MSQNTTGIEPTEYNVLVRLEKAPEKIGSIHLSSETQDRKQGLQTRGRLIAVSPLAFSYDTWEGVEPAQRPKVGDEVIIAKGAGVFIDDMNDGEYYRLLKDKDVCAIVRRPSKAAKAA